MNIKNENQINKQMKGKRNMPNIIEINKKFKFHIIGKGQPLLFIAGLGVDRTIWNSVIQKIKNNFQIIYFDNKGTGENGEFPSAENTKTMAKDVIKIIDHLNLKNITLVGHSLGGHIAQHVSATCPDRVKKLILISTRIKTSINIKLHYNVLINLMKSSTSREILIEDSLSWLYGSSYLKNTIYADKLVKERSSNPPLTSIENFFNQIKSAITHDSSKITKKIEAETIILNGEDDILCTPKEAFCLAKNIKNSKLIILRNLGHMVPIENPKELSTIIKDFCLKSKYANNN